MKIFYKTINFIVISTLFFLTQAAEENNGNNIDKEIKILRQSVKEINNVVPVHQNKGIIMRLCSGRYVKCCEMPSQGLE